MINVSRVINSPKWATSFEVYRKTGDWVNFRFVQNENKILIKGTMVPATPKDILQVPEGDRTSEIRIFLSSQQIYVTNQTGTSDEVVCKGKRYRILKVKDWSERGYYRAIGISMEGN